MVDYEKPYDYKKQVKALRYCSGTPYARCSNCPMHDKGVTDYATPCGILSDAAAAIEELQAEVDKANKSADAYRAMYFTKRGDITIEKVRELDEIDCHFHSALIRLMYKRIEELESEENRQLPKRGEWVEENRRPRSSQFVCSECHRTAYDPQPTRDKEWKKRCRYAFCPNCGAKMEVQDGK